MPKEIFRSNLTQKQNIKNATEFAFLEIESIIKKTCYKTEKTQRALISLSVAKAEILAGINSDFVKIKNKLI